MKCTHRNSIAIDRDFLSGYCPSCKKEVSLPVCNNRKVAYSLSGVHKCCKGNGHDGQHRCICTIEW